MAERDLKINARVRKILVENNLNLCYLGVSTRSGTVNIQGELKKLSGRWINENQVGKFLRRLETAILYVKDVKRVSFSIEDWEKKRGKWKKKGK